MCKWFLEMNTQPFDEQEPNDTFEGFLKTPHSFANCFSRAKLKL